MIKNSDKLAERLKGIKVGDKDLTIDLLKEIISKEDEVEITVSEAQLFTSDELTEMKTSIREEQKTTSYAEGKTAGAEMYAKDLKKLAGIEKEGKTAETVFKHISEKIQEESGKEPNEKINELTESVSNLQGVVNQKDTELKTWEDKYSSLEKNTKVNSVMSKNIPDIKGITGDQFLLLVKNEGYGIDFTESGETFTTLNGKPLKDQLEKPIPINDVLSEFAKKNNWIGTEGGRGGDDDFSSGGDDGFKTMHDVFDYMKKNNIGPMSKQGMKLQDDFEAKTQA